MKQYQPVTFNEGLLVAFIASILGSITFYVVSSVFSDSLSVKLLITGLNFFYIVYLMSRSKYQTGRLSVISAWLMITITLWFFWPTVPVFLVFQLLTIWLIRSIYYYSSLIPTVADFGLTLSGIAIALWVNSFTASLFLTLWCFFLAQALFVILPKSISPMTNSNTKNSNSEADFQQAYRVAEVAIRNLSRNQ